MARGQLWLPGAAQKAHDLSRACKKLETGCFQRPVGVCVHVKDRPATGLYGFWWKGSRLDEIRIYGKRHT
eukprot:6176952-Pleurochrysis_carterae.AAC.2